MLEDVIQVGVENIVGETAKIKLDEYRFVTMSCTVVDDDHYDILYHFDKDLRLKHLRLTVPRKIEVPSISAVYLAAFLVENEIQDLFGLRFKGLALDYERKLYLDEEVKVTPLCKFTVKETPAKVLQTGAQTELENN